MSDEQRHSVVQRLALTGVHSFQIGGFHSQWGQDRWVAAQLSGLGKDGVYVELGANDGLTHSNSAYFDKVARFRGLCIEPFADNFAALQANRPRCTNVHSGVGASSACTSAPGDGGRTLVAFSPPNTGWTGWLDTYDGGLLAARETAVGEGNITRSKVPCSTLDTLLTTHGFEHVDYLAVDTEGSELEVLRSLDWERTPPRVVQVEVVRRYVDGVLDPNPESSIEAQLLAEMEGRGYTLARVFTAPWRPPTDVSGVVPKSHDLIFQRRAAAAAAGGGARLKTDDGSNEPPPAEALPPPPSPQPAAANTAVDQVFTIDDTGSAPAFITAGAEAGLMFDMDLLFKTTLINTPGNPPREKWGWHWFMEPLFLARLRDLGASAHGTLPLAMRLGGGHQCCTLYNVTGKLRYPLPTAPYYCSVEHPGPVSIMQPTIWDAVLSALHQANISLVFGITGGYGRAATNGTRGNRWDPETSGFTELLNYTYESEVGREVAWGWELSNEPGPKKFDNKTSYHRDEQSKVSAQTLAHDVLDLSAMVHTAAALARAAHPTAKVLTPVVAGPDLSCDRTQKAIDQKLSSVRNFSGAAAPALDAVSMHYYVESSHDKNASAELRDPANLDRFGAFFDDVTAHTSASWRASGGQVWCGETASLQKWRW